MPSILLLHVDTWTIYSITIIFTLNRWFKEYIPLNFNLKKANASDTEAAFLDLNYSIHNDTVSTKIYDEREDFDFDGDAPRRPFYDVFTCISQLIRFARSSTGVKLDGKSIWIFFSKILFFLICFNTYEL